VGHHSAKSELDLVTTFLLTSSYPSLLQSGNNPATSHQKAYAYRRKTTNMSKLDAAQLFSVKGLVAVVTGASSGLGESMAHALDVNGAAKVFILGRRESKLKEVASKAVCIDFRSFLSKADTFFDR
jgi:hypothetical protein